MNEWIKVTHRLPALNQSVLVAAKKGFYHQEVHGKDMRELIHYVGFFFDYHEPFVNLKPKIMFEVECGCSGCDFDREEIDPIFWMPLPKLPEEPKDENLHRNNI